MKQKKKQATTRMPVFDGYKGLALISILAYYFYQHLLPGGYLSVNFFLLIAGFFNFRHFYVADTRGLKVNTLKFYKKRGSRLFFPMLAMVVTTGALILMFSRDYLFNLRNLGLSSLFFVNNFYQIINEQSYFVHATNPSAYTHLWYVSLLGQLLLLTPLFFKLFYSWHRKPSIAINMLGIVSLVSAATMAYLYQGGDPTNVYYNLATRAFAYTMGGILAFLLPAKLESTPLNRKGKLLLNTTSILALILLYLMSKYMYGTQAFAYRFGMVLYTLVSGLLVLSSIHSDTWVYKLLSLPPFTFLGKRSFSYYLWYYPIYLILPDMLRSLNFTLTTLIQFVLLVIFAEISYQIFEQDSIKLPFGQEFNFRQTLYRLNILKRSGKALMTVKVVTGIYLFFLVMGVLALGLAPEKRSQSESNLQSQIESNQVRIKEGTKSGEESSSDQEGDEEETQDRSNKVINNIEGLDKEELLYANGLDITFIGDSTLLAAADQIMDVFPSAFVDGEVGRQLYNTVYEVNYLQSEGLVHNTVVTMLGANGTFTDSQIDDYIEAIGQDRAVYFVTSNTNRSWVGDANAAIMRASQKYGNVQIIDWDTYANDHPEWIYEDGAHPTPEGAKELGKFIAKELYRLR